MERRCVICRVEALLLIAVFAWIFVACQCNLYFQTGSSLPPLTRRLRRRALGGIEQNSIPTSSPTREPIRVKLWLGKPFDGKTSQNSDNSDNSQQDVDGTSPSNDHDYYSPRDNFDKPDSSSIDGTRRLALISVSLSTIFVALLLSIVAWTWRLYLGLIKEDGSDQDGSQEFPNENAFSPNHKSAKAGESILRNGVSGSPDLNPGRRVRFYLPGSPAVVDQAVIESAERDEGALHDPKLVTPRKIKRAKANNSYVEAFGLPSNSLDQHQTLPPIQEVDVGDTRDFESTGIAPRPATRNDPETWVSRIMHPWLDSSPLCCQEYCDDFNSSSNQQEKTPSEESILEHATLGASSFDSNAMNDTSSVTPMLPPFPTSSKIDEDNDSLRNEIKEREPHREMFSVLGIMDRQEAENQAHDALVLEEATNGKKRLREATPPPPPCDYGWEGDQATWTQPSARKPWVNFDVKRKRTAADRTQKNPVEDEFDPESESNSDYGTGYYGPGRSGRLAEI